MKTIIKPVNLSQTKVKSMFKKHATGIVKVLRSKGIRMIKKIEYRGYRARGDSCYRDCVDSCYWNSCITKKNSANIHIRIDHEKISGNYIFRVNFTVRINSLKDRSNETELEKMLRIKTENMIDEKYPLSNTRVTVVVKNPEIPNLNLEKIVARQLYLALKIYDKIYSPETISRIKEVEKTINKLLEKETDAMLESLLQ